MVSLETTPIVHWHIMSALLGKLKAKCQYLLACEVSRCCLLTLHGRAGVLIRYLESPTNPSKHEKLKQNCVNVLCLLGFHHDQVRTRFILLKSPCVIESGYLKYSSFLVIHFWRRQRAQIVTYYYCIFM